VKKFAGKITEIKPLYLIVAGVLVAVLIVAGILLVAVGGDGGSDGPNPTLGVGEGDASQLPGSRRKPPKQAPVVHTGLLDEARREGRLAVAQARGTIVSPTRVRIRVSAAPKQTVTVNYQLGCFRNRRVRVGRGSYRTRPPDTRGVPLPMSAAKSCIVTASAQLTKVIGSGRIQVSVIAGG
jgi:hypothetical protein